MTIASRLLRPILLALLVPALCACGFTLRGMDRTAFSVDTLYLESSGAGRLQRELAQTLRAAGVTVREPPADTGEYLLSLSNVQRDARRTTLNTGTRGAQYELSLSVTASLYRDGQRVAEPETLSVQRQQNEDISNLTSSATERDMLYEDMQRELARRISQRLRALEPAS